METIIGKTLLNQFHVDGLVSSGEMGAVYRVWDIKRNIPLAMKIVDSELAADPAIFKRFQGEADALEKLVHPNIVPFYGLYQTEDLAFRLEGFIDGASLKDILSQRQGQPMTVNEALNYMKALCAALRYAHANGVVHGNIKPGNVMVDRDESIYLTDFGMARHAESTSTSIDTAGSPAYLAPEQIRGEEATPRTDVYALGVLLFEMLTGRRPFHGDEAGTEKVGSTANEPSRYGILNLAPPDPRSLNPDIPEGLSTAILKALSKQPEDRYASTQALLFALFSQIEPTPATVPERTEIQALPAQPEPTSGQAAMPASEAPREKARGMAPKWPTWGIAGIALMALLVLVAWGGGIYTLARANSVSAPAKAVIQTPFATISPSPMDNQTPVSLFPSNTPNPTATSTIAFIPTKTLPVPTAAPTNTLPPTASPTNTLPAPTVAPTNTLPLPTVAPTNTLPLPTASLGSLWTRPSDGMVMVPIPAGIFTMGTNDSNYPNARPGHQVEMDDYWIDRTDVTNAMFQKFVNSGYQTEAEKNTFGVVFQPDQALPQVALATWLHPRGPSTAYGGLDHPVVQVSWNDAMAYCAWAGSGMHLPTEAQWEKAGRGTDARNFPWGNEGIGTNRLNYGDENLNAWLKDWNLAHPEKPVSLWGAPGNDGYLFTSPVGHYPQGASPYGALDMSGDVAQWVLDGYADGYDSQIGKSNPQGPDNTQMRVVRGGWWAKTTADEFIFVRAGQSPNTSTDFIGFRCATSLIP